MADIVKQKSTLSMVAEFTDGDDRTLTVDNPNTAINLAACVNSLGSYAKDNEIIVGDKAGADFVRFRSAKITNSATTYLDLTVA